jgi:hypothetical protein
VTAVTVQTVLVGFEGDGSGVDELTWGQREIWAAFELADASIPTGGAMALPAGTTVDEAVHVLRFAMSRHQSLRTRYRCDERGHPVAQVLAAAGEIAMEIYDVADDDDPASVAEDITQRYENTDFDYATEWPLRYAVIRHRGSLTHAVAVYCHLAIDGYGLEALARDLGHLDRSTGKANAPVVGATPLQQAREQRSAGARRTSDAAIRYWERQLRSVTARRFPGSAGGRSPRYYQAGYTSPAMYLALRRIAGRTRVDSAVVLLAAYSVVLAELTKQSRSLIREVVSNRFRPGFAETVSVVNQTGPCVIDVAGLCFDEVVARAWRASMGARMHAYYDPRRLKELVAALSAERGEEFDISCLLNDRRRRHRLDGFVSGVEPTLAEVRSALPRSVFRWEYQLDRPNERLFVHINDVPDVVYVQVCGDTNYLAPSDLEAVAYGLERVLVEAA